MSKICRTFAAENERIMKKMYNKPEIEVAQVTLNNIICYSAGEGPDTSSITGGDPIGD